MAGRTHLILCLCDVRRWVSAYQLIHSFAEQSKDKPNNGSDRQAKKDLRFAMTAGSRDECLAHCQYYLARLFSLLMSMTLKTLQDESGSGTEEISYGRTYGALGRCLGLDTVPGGRVPRTMGLYCSMYYLQSSDGIIHFATAFLITVFVAFQRCGNQAINNQGHRDRLRTFVCRRSSLRFIYF